MLKDVYSGFGLKGPPTVLFHVLFEFLVLPVGVTGSLFALFFLSLEGILQKMILMQGCTMLSGEQNEDAHLAFLCCRKSMIE